MSAGSPASASPSKAEDFSVPGGGGKKRDPSGAAAAHLIVKDVGEIYSRLLDHRPVIQGEIRYFVKEFEEKRGFREVRVLESLKSTVLEANAQTLPKCEQVMHDSLQEALSRLQAGQEMVSSLLQQREQEGNQLQGEKRRAGEKERAAQWEEFLKEQHSLKAVVDEEHAKAMERLKEQYALMEKDLTKHAL